MFVVVAVVVAVVAVVANAIVRYCFRKLLIPIILLLCCLWRDTIMVAGVLQCAGENVWHS